MPHTRIITIITSIISTSMSLLMLVIDAGFWCSLLMLVIDARY
jgi:hypothetical protein